MKKLSISFLALLLVAMCSSAWSGQSPAEDLHDRNRRTLDGCRAG